MHSSSSMMFVRKTNTIEKSDNVMESVFHMTFPI